MLYILHVLYVVKAAKIEHKPPIAMHFFTDNNILLYTSCTIRGLVTATPLYSKTIDMARDGPPNGGILTVISTDTVKEFQLA